ncbi:hypothetical protein EV12_2139 [Prochlorococcus sp. MIT 0701]|nr:hypothetical protein EV12_2139 [Prochlorococcus sp. MIT 0701]
MLKQTFRLQRAWQRRAPFDDEACDEVHGWCQITKQWNFELVLIATNSKWCFNSQDALERSELMKP